MLKNLQQGILLKYFYKGERQKGKTRWIQEEILLNNPRVDLIQLERNLTLELYDLRLVKESFYKQKS